MRDRIVGSLKMVEREYGVRVLFAVESGSRAWGFASPNSDWDVRFIYAHPQDWYLSVHERRDVIERMLPDDIDLSGWDLRKAMRLFYKSNPPLLEWLDSPHVYMEQGCLRLLMQEARDAMFKPEAGVYHYLAMARRNWKEYLQDYEVRLKKYLYVLRPLLACSYIEREGRMAPMKFADLLATEKISPIVRDAIDGLLERKMNGPELGTGPCIDELDIWISERMAHYEFNKPAFNPRQKFASEDLDMLFRTVVSEREVAQGIREKDNLKA